MASAGLTATVRAARATRSRAAQKAGALWVFVAKRFPPPTPVPDPRRSGPSSGEAGEHRDACHLRAPVRHEHDLLLGPGRLGRGHRLVGHPPCVRPFERPGPSRHLERRV